MRNLNDLAGPWTIPVKPFLDDRACTRSRDPIVGLLDRSRHWAIISGVCGVTGVPSRQGSSLIRVRLMYDTRFLLGDTQESLLKILITSTLE